MKTQGDKEVFEILKQGRREANTDPYEELLLKMQEYNALLDLTNQEGLTNESNFEGLCFDLTEWGVEDGVVGYIDIPAMEVTLPIYLGASDANLRKGAAVLNCTSLPISATEGVSTNCVLAAHRGYGKAAMFRNIERLKAGDQITITNLWETLTYEVVETRVILPSEIDQILIQDGRELLTLITCHPYRKNYQRYVVFCRRTG